MHLLRRIRREIELYREHQRLSREIHSMLVDQYQILAKNTRELKLYRQLTLAETEEEKVGRT